ncbi:sensor histidine kinase [Bacillus sp. 165]|uniref:sensor histidine kinase n=1 Tax=Bacillus sp. 165 TaxID=1529117 RepID=UPI001ADD5999|nr:sensor histidine kinase [Bacillus sp. 165]MBO9128329.1 sensor histidine kinase [Bacillus sp. 165]
MNKQTSIQWTYLNYFILTCLGVSLLVTGIYAWQSRENVYTFLIGHTVASIPVSLFIVGISLMIGSVIGYALGQKVKKRVDEMSTLLLEIERGNFNKPLLSKEQDEFSLIEERVVTLAERFEKQAEHFQALTNERASWNEEMKQEAISQERHRLARDLHDSVSQQLFAMSMMMAAVNEKIQVNSESTRKQLLLIEQMIVNAQAEMRALLLHLRPVQLEGKKLNQGIEELLKELERKQKMKMEWHLESVDLERGVEDHLFRIVQEALSNTLRHSKAKRMELRLRNINQYAILKIIDDGIGFNIHQRKTGSYGLQSMQERVNEVGGALKIISLPNKGTQIEVKVPILAREGEQYD